MLRSFLALALVLLAFSAHGFAPRSSTAHRSSRFVLGLTADEILARAREKTGIPAAEEGPPKLFEDDLLDDMQQTLLKLDKRVKEGPGSLSVVEVEELNAELGRILDEMKMNEHKKPERPPRAQETSVPPPPPAAAVAAPVQPAPQVPSTPVAPQPVVPETVENPIMDTSLDEGPAYDGTGGMGQPKGTVNTYVIPGMDEMSPEEYQKALQESVINRQKKRKGGLTTGNKASWDYLNALTGEKGILKEGTDQ